MISIINGNNTDILKEFPNNMIDMVLTSPPYDNIRTYKIDLNKVWNFEKFKILAKELYRVLKDGGVAVWVVNDQTVKGSETGNSFRQALYFMEIGFRLHDTMIYAKENYIPLTHKRYEQMFEYMFVFSKGKPKTFNPIKIKSKKSGTQKRFIYRDEEGNLIKKKYECKIKEYKLKGNVWFYKVGNNMSTKDKIAFKHPAIFPEQLAYDHIYSWSNEGDLILDPFAGSGTTLKMAKILNRNAIGIEINKDYIKIIKERLKKG